MVDLHIDIESRSEIDLIKRGAYNYAKHPSTLILCICYAFDDGSIQRWDCLEDDWPADLLDALEDDTVKLWAHNANFERLMFEHIVMEGIPVSRWYCTAVLARHYALPSALGDIAKCLRLPVGKLDAGRNLIQRMSIPPYEFNEALLKEMVGYCAGDVVVERYIHGLLPDIRAEDWAQYHVSEEINDRGIRLDRDFAKLASEQHARIQGGIKREFKKLTGFTSPGSSKFTQWLYAELTDIGDLAQLMIDLSKTSGVSLGADIVDELLSHELPQHLRVLLEYKQAYSRSSATKFAAMLQRMDDDDDRARGSYIFAGAAKTGRYSSRGLQLHNAPRDHIKDLSNGAWDNPVEYMDHALDTGELETAYLPGLIRPALMPADNKIFICGDWSQIEARVLPWASLAPGRRGAASKYIEVFSDPERDIYVETAAALPGELNDRQIGKVAVLSLGYGGGVGAFQAMAKGYGVKISDSQANAVKLAWRDANSWATHFWRVLHNAALDAMDNPEEVFTAGKVSFTKSGDNLMCYLPSGRFICYLDAKVHPAAKPYQLRPISAIKGSLKPKKDAPAGYWPRESLWGGFLAENVTQAIAGDVMRECLLRLSASKRLEVVGHTHDEALVEVYDMDVDKAPESAEWAELKRVMDQLPEWADGLPLEAELWAGYYYRK